MTDEHNPLTVDQAAAALGMAPGGVKKAIEQGRLAATRLGGTPERARILLIAPEEIARYRRERRPAGRGGQPRRDELHPRQQQRRLAAAVTARGDGAAPALRRGGPVWGWGREESQDPWGASQGMPAGGAGGGVVFAPICGPVFSSACVTPRGTHRRE